MPATVSYDVASRIATLDPTGLLSSATSYTALIKGGATDPRAKDVAGNALANDVTWTFSTAGSSPFSSIWDVAATPTVASADDPNAVELGVKFQSDVDGHITGIRFYKGDLNTGTHIGNLWDSSGQLLASATFVDPAGENYWPGRGSALIGRADPEFACERDFNGTLRKPPFDVGAYESEGLEENPGWHLQAGFKAEIQR